MTERRACFICGSGSGPTVTTVDMDICGLGRVPTVSDVAQAADWSFSTPLCRRN